MSKQNIYSCDNCGKEKCLFPSICEKYRQIKTLKKFGFDKKKLGTEEAYKEFIRTKRFIEDMYFEKNYSIVDLEKEFKVTRGTLIELFKNMHIITRSISDSTKLAYKNKKIKSFGNHKKYINGWHITWNNKRIYYRSSYELNYAIYLDENCIDYSTEDLRIEYFDTKENTNRISIPDFYLPDYNLIVEIKSEWTLDVQNMIDKANQYLKDGYNFQLVCEGEDWTDRII